MSDVAKETVTDDYLIRMGFSLSWIRHNASNMNAFCRPRRYYLADVDAYMQSLRDKTAAKRQASQIRREATHNEMMDMVNEVIARNQPQPAKIIPLKRRTA